MPKNRISDSSESSGSTVVRAAKASLLAAVCFGVSGCMSYLRENPYIDEEWASWRHLPADPIALANAAYVAREMVPSSDRPILAAKVKAVEPSQIGDGKSNAAWGAGAVAAQVINGNAFSTAGVHTASHVAAGLTILGALLPDGSSSAISGIYLPQSWKEAELNKDTALSAAWSYIEEKARAGAAAIDFSIECYADCESPVKRTYLLTRTKPHQAWRVDPDFMLLKASLPKAGLTKIEKQDPLLVKALGFEPAWFTGSGNKAPLELLQVVKGPDGKPDLIVPNKPETIRTVGWDLRKVKLGHFFLKAFYSDRYAYIGMTENKVRQVVYNGVIYPFERTTGNDFLKDTLADDFLEGK